MGGTTFSPPGPPGFQGLSGRQGENGKKGEVGDQGPSGFLGSQGSRVRDISQAFTNNCALMLPHDEKNTVACWTL